MGSVSRLTVGTSKLKTKPPRGNPPCTEPIKYGANILSDPGFELQLAQHGGGTLGDSLQMWQGYPPVRNPNYWSWPGVRADEATWPAAPSPFPFGWCQWGSVNDPGYVHSLSYWQVSTANPRTGTYHLRQTDNQIQTSSPDVSVFGFRGCPGSPTDYPWSFKAMPGDFYRFGLWATSADGGSTRIDFDLSFYDSDGTGVGGNYNQTYLTTSYAYYEMSGFVPAALLSVYALVSFTDADGGNAGGNHIDIDDCVLEVS